VVSGAPHPPAPWAARPSHRGDRVFLGLTRGASILVVVIMVAIATFLAVKAVPALHKDTRNFFTTRVWEPDSRPAVFGIATLVFGTLLSSLIAVVIATPVALGVSLFITHYAPRRLARLLGYIVDLLAAVPSVVYGLWGLYFLAPKMVPLSRFLSRHLGWFPPFHGNGEYGHSMFEAGVILAIMILPIIAALTREVFLQVPTILTEAATALGATRWEMLRTVVLPYGRSGIVSAVMLGLGRALGETIAVALVLFSSFTITDHVLNAGGNTIAAEIATYFGEAGSVGQGALIAAGLVLFAVTLVVNLVARTVVARRLPGVS
jgi:phosphate transport system permease protein